MTDIIVWQRKGRKTIKVNHRVASPQEASRLARTQFKGQRVKIVNNRTGRENQRDLRSYTGMMAIRFNY